MKPKSKVPDICKTCGFDKNLPRDIIISDCNPLSISSYLEGVCEECGHQKDGSTIKRVEGELSPTESTRKIEYINATIKLVGEIKGDVDEGINNKILSEKLKSIIKELKRSLE